MFKFLYFVMDLFCYNGDMLNCDGSDFVLGVGVLLCVNLMYLCLKLGLYTLVYYIEYDAHIACLICLLEA